jgi:hypothetical protein
MLSMGLGSGLTSSAVDWVVSRRPWLWELDFAHDRGHSRKHPDSHGRSGISQPESNSPRGEGNVSHQHPGPARISVRRNLLTRLQGADAGHPLATDGARGGVAAGGADYLVGGAKVVGGDSEGRQRGPSGAPGRAPRGGTARCGTR